jgi:hypothetical protein
MPLRYIQTRNAGVHAVEGSARLTLRSQCNRQELSVFVTKYRLVGYLTKLYQQCRPPGHYSQPHEFCPHPRIIFL